MLLLTGLLLGAALGFVLQRGRFCVTGAFRDVFVARKTKWLTAFILVIAVQAVGVAALEGMGVIGPHTDPLPLLAVVGGSLIFGFSIVLAGGCATGTIYRSGEGLVGSWIALIFYAASAGAMKYGVFADFTSWARSSTVGLTTIHETLGVSSWLLVAALGAATLYLVHRHLSVPRVPVASLPPRRTGLAHVLLEKRWDPFATAVVIGLIAIAAWPLSTATGREGGLGITTPAADIATYLVTADTTLIDWAVFLVVGIVLGSFIAAKASGEFRVRVPDATTVVRSIAGGIGMGVGAALAGGCTIGAAMVATARFSYEGWLAFAFMLLGTGLAAKVYIINPRNRAAAPAAPAPAPVRA
jgi:hypothetical protein